VETKEVFGLIMETLNELEDEKVEIGLNDEFKNIGLNSISFVRLVVALEDKFGIEFSDEYLDYEHYNTVTDFCNYVRELLEQKK